ncbi:Tex family protein [Pseudonocardia abyssalis]|uniref:RNA-binding transcriptional accessory protein n=1 Tax=Pseudonocardia abyssalis TaxID=2792008 RepID=A0ABS6UQR5_9PSEU|nr:Tex family protein [Pseudonocardia abyssalis]MBW0115736.1 RNA-binding transcriptional accessory protein [Pseudonocardia abyssalis]MBW0134601.1 RNA-binding transcriptional accessory protein [Pseudonocardia abyssalis]
MTSTAPAIRNTVPHGPHTVEQRIADELGVRPHQVAAAVGLLDGGATVPFIARYRKEATGTLDDAQLRTLEERLGYLRELEDRRAAVLEEIRKQGKLEPELEGRIRAAESKARLEDVYLPFKPKRRTKAMAAREAGLEPLADALLGDPSLDPQGTAAGYLNDTVADVAAALEGARAILVERFGEDADLIGGLRERMWTRGVLVTKVQAGKEAEGAKFSDYFDFSEPFTKLPSHRILAALRGEKEEILDLSLEPDREPAEPGVRTDYEATIAKAFGISDEGRPADKWLGDVVRWAWRTRILLHLGIDIRVRLRTVAEEGAIGVFATNLRDLLLAAPAGSRATMGLDPGLRTGVKVAVVDATGKVVATDTIYPHEPRRDWKGSLATLTRLAAAHDVDLVAIGNGTASRETDQLARELAATNPALKLTPVMVSEAGASVYSASAFASAELPDLDVSIRGAVSIARRLQDPLAELVKIDPKSIGVGQYQHDLAESALSRSLDAVVEDCVNAVGVDVNTASVPLLRRVSGITEGLATQIVLHRDTHGPFRTRTALADVPRLGPKAFEQCAGFLRIRGGDDPIDMSGVHPEAYPVVRRIVETAKVDVSTLIGNASKIKTLRAKDFVDETFGLPTVSDILGELEKPGRDPRPAFRTATFADGVHKISDLRPGMLLEGQVTNVAAFGAFVDVGVHQDGLVHVSAMSKDFVSDPREVVKNGDVVRVKVMEVDEARKRISLTLRLDDEVGADGKPVSQRERRSGGGRPEGDRPGGGPRGAGPRQGAGQGGGGKRSDPKRSDPRRGDPRRGDGKRIDAGRGGQGGGGRGAGSGGSRGGSSSSPGGGGLGNSAMADALRRAGLADGGKK